MRKNDNFIYFNLLILCMWLQVINKVKVTHQGEGHIKVKVKISSFLPTICKILLFLGGLSLHLNHIIASHTANYDWPFGTLPFGLFGSNLDTRDLETYPRTCSGHF